LKYAFLVFYKFKKLTADEEWRAREEWREILREWPEEVKLVGIYDHAWGTEYNGFLLLECEDMDKFVEFWKKLRDNVRWYVKETRTVIAVKRE